MPSMSLPIVLAPVLVLIIVAVGAAIVWHRLTRSQPAAGIVVHLHRSESLIESGGGGIDAPAPTARPRAATPWETHRLSADSITGGVEQTLDELSNPLTTYINVRRPGDTRVYPAESRWKLRHGSVAKIVKIEPEDLGRVHPPLLIGKTSVGRFGLPPEDS
ncbi:hypothetical protein EXIGLDRAFT_767251 [Exidia glandulosa HHB12029]|uniref:Uncharacterized protein n=1 Tax=Exidia glandulosa HHB12029 TaxID=1314781 RepID=A0A165J3V6_EXIGL|nr:hypothetical protein EXIGLDRAFT_767251 [Exidia glandulosa HHB12029]